MRALLVLLQPTARRSRMGSGGVVMRPRGDVSLKSTQKVAPPTTYVRASARIASSSQVRTAAYARRRVPRLTAPVGRSRRPFRQAPGRSCRRQHLAMSRRRQRTAPQWRSSCTRPPIRRTGRPPRSRASWG